MIAREELADALTHLDPREREILEYSLRRRVPDEDLSEIIGGDPSGVARRRAAAIEHLSDALNISRGEDLGQVLKLLLDADTWALVPAPAAPDEDAEEDQEESAGHKPVGATGSDGPPPGAMEEPVSEVPSIAQRKPKESATPEPERQPVLGMLAGRTDERGQTRGRNWAVIAGVALAVLIPAAAVIAVSLGHDDADGNERQLGDAGTRPFTPEPQAVGDAFPTDPEALNRYPIALIRRPTTLYDRPNGKPKVRIQPKTDWDSPRWLGVVRREGSWVAVTVPELDNGEVGWLPDSKIAQTQSVAWSIHADLSDRTVDVRRGGRTVRTFKVGIGRADHPTPVGRYAVTDKLRVSDQGSPYGCCVVALTGHQTKLPPGWPGGDRLAIHATRDLSGLGREVSLGCMRSHPKDAQWLLKRIPIGTPVFVES